MKREVAAVMAAAAWVIASMGGEIAAQNLPPEVVAYADLILHNGLVLTADDRFTIGEAVAIRDGKFLAVGSNDRILAMAGPATRKIHLNGKTVVPAFINSHLHLADRTKIVERWERAQAGEFDKQKSLAMAGAVLESIRKEAAERPGQWIVRYYSGRFREAVLEGELTKQKLDAVAPHHPVAIGYMTDSFWLLNSEGLKQADIGADVRGLQRDERTGELTGIVQGDAAYVVANEVASWVGSFQQKIDRIREGIRMVNAQGITTIHTRVNPDGLTAVNEMRANGQLTLRWRVAIKGLRGLPDSEMEKFFKRLGNLTGIGDDLVRIVGMAPGATDGSPEAGRGWTFSPKLRVMPGTYTDPYGYNPPNANATLKNIRIAAKYGWSPVGIHSIGDRGTAEALSAYEQGLAERVVETSHQKLRLDHLMIVRSEDLRKMKEFNVVPSVAAWHMYVPVDAMVYMYGADAVANKMIWTRAFIEAGLKPVGENSSYHPLWNIERHVTRKDKNGRVWGRQEKVTREEALWMHTNWVAHYIGEADRLGTIEPGKLADLAVLDGDYMKIPEDQISQLRVVMTFLGGKIVYDKERDGFVVKPSWEREALEMVDDTM